MAKSIGKVRRYGQGRRGEGPAYAVCGHVCGFGYARTTDLENQEVSTQARSVPDPEVYEEATWTGSRCRPPRSLRSSGRAPYWKTGLSSSLGVQTAEKQGPFDPPVTPRLLRLEA